jgi:hypothetical protein
MSKLKTFGRFWADFLIGDDPRIAVGVAVSLVVSALLVATALPAWWFMPAAAVALLAYSLQRATRAS